MALSRPRPNCDAWVSVRHTAFVTLRAIVREVPASIGDCQLTHVPRARIDVSRAREQHADYVRALEQAGCSVTMLEELPAYPDSVFVEDTVLVFPELAVLTRPGATTRRGEVEYMRSVLSPWRLIAEITAPATLDGGDVLTLGKTVWVGRSSRTNALGVTQIRAILSPFDYVVKEAVVQGALHLKTAVTQAGEHQLLIHPGWIDRDYFPDWELIPVDPIEPFSANAVFVGGCVIHSTAFPLTQQRLREHGISPIGVDASELAKAEGGVTCCSVIIT